MKIPSKIDTLYPRQAKTAICLAININPLQYIGTWRHYVASYINANCDKLIAILSLSSLSVNSGTAKLTIVN